MMLHAVGVFAEAGHRQAVAVFVDRSDGADDGELVPHAGLARHEFADLDAGDVSGDGTKLAAIFDGGVGLEIVHVHMRGAAGQVDHNGGFARRACASGFCGAGLEAEHVGKREAGRRTRRSGGKTGD